MDKVIETENTLLDTAICKALNLEFDAYNGKITVIFRIKDPHDENRKLVRTFTAPRWHEDINAAEQLLKSFVSNHRKSAGPALYYGYYFDVSLNQAMDWTVTLCGLDENHQAERFEKVSAVSQSLAFAICKAWLKALEFVGDDSYCGDVTNYIMRIRGRERILVRKDGANSAYLVVDDCAFFYLNRHGRMIKC